MATPVMTKQKQSTTHNIFDPSRKLFSVCVAILFSFICSVSITGRRKLRKQFHTNSTETNGSQTFSKKGLTFYMTTAFRSQPCKNSQVLAKTSLIQNQHPLMRNYTFTWMNTQHRIASRHANTEVMCVETWRYVQYMRAHTNTHTRSSLIAIMRLTYV